MNRQPDKTIKRVISIQKERELKDTILPRGSKTICVLCNEKNYMQLLENNTAFKEYLNNVYLLNPEIFPKAMENGYVLDGFTKPSQKITNFRMKRIKMVKTGEIYIIRPSYVTPYMTAYTKNVEKALYLRKHAVPYSTITRTFGRNDMYWHRLEKSVGRNSIVGTLIKDPSKLPQDLVADEKVTHLNGSKVYVAETAAKECILGAAVCNGVSNADLTEGYGIFQKESKNINPKYEPNSVNIDGYKSTYNAWQANFANITIIQCFLHAFINIRDRCRKHTDQFNELKQKVWHVYRAKTKKIFSQRIRRLKEYALSNLPQGVVLDKVISLCSKSSLFQKAYDHPNSHRTSNMVDRLMKQQDRYLFMTQYFHGDFISAELNVRAWAILHNFWPYCTRTADKQSKLDCPATRLNGFRYADNWLENLLISASMAGYRQ